MRPITRVSSILVLVVASWPASALEKIPQKSGFGGFANVGVGYASVDTNLIARAAFVDFDETIASLADSPDSKTSAIPALNFEVNYTFASSRTQVYVGNRLEDFLQLDSSSGLGVRQEVGKNVLALAVVRSGKSAEVWQDPYVTGVAREKTDRTSTGIRLTWDKVLGSQLEVELTTRHTEIDDELSGVGLGLTPAERDLLRREGDVRIFTAQYPVRLGPRAVVIPGIRLRRWDLDGKAMSADAAGVALTYARLGPRFGFTGTFEYASADFDETNPIFLKKRKDDTLTVGLILADRKAIKSERWSLLYSVIYARQDTNIDFYDSGGRAVTVSALYKF